MGAGESRQDQAERNNVIEQENINRLRIQEERQRERMQILENQIREDRNRRAEAMQRLTDEAEKMSRQQRELMEDANQRDRYQIERRDRLQQENQATTERAEIRNLENLENFRANHESQMNLLIERNAEEVKNLKKANIEAERLANEQLKKLKKGQEKIHERLVRETKRHTKIQLEQQASNRSELLALEREQLDIENQGQENLSTIAFQIEHFRVEGEGLQIRTQEAHEKENGERNYVQIIRNARAAVSNARKPINDIVSLKRIIEGKRTEFYVQATITVNLALKSLATHGITIERELRSLIDDNERNIDDNILIRQDIAKEAIDMITDLEQLLLDLQFYVTDLTNCANHDEVLELIPQVKELYAKLSGKVMSIPTAYVQEHTANTLMDNIRIIGDMRLTLPEPRRAVAERNEPVLGIENVDVEEQDPSQLEQ